MSVHTRGFTPMRIPVNAHAFKSVQSPLLAGRGNVYRKVARSTSITRPSPEAFRPPAIVCRSSSKTNISRDLSNRRRASLRSGYCPSDVAPGGLVPLLRNACGILAAIAASCSLLLQPIPANADTIIRVPKSEDSKVLQVQQTMLEAWRIINDSFEDASFNGRDWERDLGEALTAAYWSSDDQQAQHHLAAMVDNLNDPYTRVMPAEEYRQFRVASKGEIQGVGLLLSQDPSSRRLLVMASLADSPASRAGVQPGDEVIAIDGHGTFAGENGAAALLRGTAGSSVSVRFVRRSPGVPGVAARPEAPERMQYRQVTMKRERLEVNPVFSTSFNHESAKGPMVTGYIRLVNFNVHAATDVKHAITDLQGRGAHNLILDLRQNPGGLVRGSVDIARLFLDSSTDDPAAIFTVAGRGPATQQQVFHRVAIDDSRAVTKAPLAVLVDGQSASAAEILAGALRDNGHRAVLIGDTSTFGKGKIQNVFELSDDSALFVTVARYKTPALSEIDEVGLPPELLCHPQDTTPPGAQAGGGGGSSAIGQHLSKEERRSMPPGVAGGLAMQMVSSESLRNDACVLTAERWLDDQPDWK